MSTGEVLERLYVGLWRFTAACCGSSYDPDDVLQEALLRTLRIRPLDELDHPAAYVRKAVLSVLANESRRTSPLPLPHGTDAADRPVAYPSDLSDLLRLAPSDRAVLYLVDVEGTPFDEVAAVLGCTAAAARQRASRARRSLRAALEQEVDP